MQEYAIMPGRDTAPGFLLRRRACAGIWPAVWPNEPKLLKRNTEGGWRRTPGHSAIQALRRETETGVIAAEAARSAVLEPDPEAHCENR
jgi:hypothetical protein